MGLPGAHRANAPEQAAPWPQGLGVTQREPMHVERVPSQSPEKAVYNPGLRLAPHMVTPAILTYFAPKAIRDPSHRNAVMRIHDITYC